ncbi:MAG: hypothetical protein GXY80_02170 [Syntrophorhabdus aromaticivorans]|uniref:Uncharacterized protein n=1 Tax=Syntrophorhabdus aromaticivorans TaxID=328301 RepID=A0A971M268_9BACT|nr:hypothetical protein [Syntrophorhabdus aromaticivorans]
MIKVLNGIAETKHIETIANIDKGMEEQQLELIGYANSGKDYESLAEEIQKFSKRK